MAKIRWKKGEKEQLVKDIESFNRKRRREIKKNPELLGKIPTIPAKSTVKNIKTREELNKLRKELKLAKKKDAFKLVKVGEVKIPKLELDITKSRLRSLNAKRAAKRRKAKVSTEKGTMGTIAQANLLPKKISKPKSKTEWEKFKETLEKQLAESYDSERDKQYRANYLAAFLETYGLVDATELMQLLEQLTADEIAQAMFRYPLLNIEFLYDEREDSRISHIEDVINTWKKYIKEIRGD